MKLNNLKSYQISQKYNNHQKAQNAQKGQNQPSFTGSFSVNFWDAIARGGFAASFTVQDMTGTNFPRTYQALQRNKDITGENNYKAAAEVAIREFMTGPSMCIIPMVVLAIAKKVSGKVNEVPMENIAPFADEMKDVLEHNKIKRMGVDFPKNSPAQYAERVKKEFYERMFALSLGETPTETRQVSQNAKELAEMLMEYDNAPKRGFLKQMLKIDLKSKASDGANVLTGQKIEAKDQIYDKIVTKFSDIKKHTTEDYTTLLVTDMNKKLDKPNKVTTLFKDVSNFALNVQDEIKNHTSKSGAISTVGLDFNSFMDTFKPQHTGSKFTTNILMVLATALFLIKIPKLYTLYKTNPETDAFRKQTEEGNKKC